MSEDALAQRLKSVLNQAKEREKEYDWLEAAKFCQQTLRLVGKRDFLKKGEVQERLGFCFCRAAFQAEMNEDFRKRMQLAVEAYEKAIGFYGKPRKPSKTAETLRCEAMIAYNGYWLALEAGEKKRLIDECWRLVKEALKAFEEAGQALEYGKTYDQFSSTAFFAYVFEWDSQAGEKIIKEAMERGEQAVTLLSSVGDSEELARALVKVAFYSSAFALYFIPEMDVKERYYRKGQGCWQKACEVSEEAALIELSSTSCSVGDEFGWNFDEIIVNFKKALGRVKKTKDKYACMHWA